jgi:hypothetical protein
MRYRTILDDLVIDFNGDTRPATVTLTDLNDAPDSLGVVIRSTQLGAIKVLRRSLNDLFDAEREAKDAPQPE